MYRWDYTEVNLTIMNGKMVDTYMKDDFTYIHIYINIIHFIVSN